jgi:hypothetical protein
MRNALGETPETSATARDHDGLAVLAENCLRNWGSSNSKGDFKSLFGVPPGWPPGRVPTLAILDFAVPRASVDMRLTMRVRRR